MLPRVTLVLILVIIPKITKAQSVSTLMGARSNSLGNASSTLSDDWSLFNNVAGLSKTMSTTTSFAYAINPSLPGADRAAVAVTLPIRIGAIGVGLFRFGDELYSEQVISTGYANQFGLASLGIKVNYVQYRAEGFGTKSLLSINFGGIAEITPMISVGAYIVNLNQPKLSNIDDERLPTKLISGIQFIPSDELLLIIEIEKDINFKPTIKSGIEYEIYKKVKLRTGFNLNPNTIHGGVGYQSSRLNVDYAIQYSPMLKTQFQISSGYRFKKRKKEE